MAESLGAETFWERVRRIEHNHNVGPAVAIRVARAEERFEAMKENR